MRIDDAVGYSAGLLIMISFLPQLIKSYRTKRVHDLSLLMIIASLLGTILWITYGLLANSMPILISNTIFLFSIASLLVIKIKYE